ncbi:MULTISPECIES: Fic family protein [Slackia]|uniref:Fic family protein n=1 Tax=Slackia TaxID=84108 RepID=UPI002F91FCBE
MAQFEYDKTLDTLMTPEVVSALGDIRELKGKTASLSALNPETFSTLVEVAKIQSTGASNRIENISTSDKRLRELMIDKTDPRNRNEREIAGYRYVLDEIHESHDDIPVTPNVILQLHRDLYRFSGDSHGGKWKDSDNVIAERTAEGELVARFVPTSAAGTPFAVEKICSEYSKQIDDGAYDPLLVSLIFVFDFVSIHPFNDGNGRMSRLLTLLLMYRNGYDVGKYVSIEREIEASKETYYEALAASSSGWQNGENDYVPFVTYMLGIVIACYRELDSRFSVVALPTGNEEAIRAFFGKLIGTATKREIMDANPNMSQRTLERILAKLQDEGVVEKVGAARSTAYRRRE